MTSLYFNPIGMVLFWWYSDICKVEYSFPFTKIFAKCVCVRKRNTKHLYTNK